MKNITLYGYGRSIVDSAWKVNKSKIVNRLYYVNSGNAVITTENAEHRLYSGKIYIIPQSKTFKPLHAESFDHTYFDFFSSMLMVHNQLIEFDASLLSSNAFFEYINRLLMNDKEHVSIEKMELLLSAFLELIKSVVPIQYINNSIVTSAIDIIHGNYSDISSKQLAKYLNINESYFIRTFTETMGISPMKYIRAVRVAYAKELILNGDSITAAAEKCGYSSPTALYNATRSELDLSPSELKFKY